MIDPAFLDELDRFHGSLSRRARSRRSGERESPAVGEGLTFSDYRRYTPGDEPRRVDWKLYARTGELHVKQFEEERQATVHVLLDDSASMDFGEGPAHKFEFGAKVALGFAYLTARERDSFQVSLFDRSVRRIDDDRSTRGEVLRLIDRCNEVDPSGETAFDEALPTYAGTIGSKALVVIVSDFLADPATIGTGIASLADSDVVLAHLLAPGERSPPATGDTVFEAPEVGETIRAYFRGRLVDRYREDLDAHVDDVAGIARDAGARHEVVDTGEEFFEAFADLWFD